MTPDFINDNLNDENHIFNYKENFLYYLKFINPYTDVLVKNLDNIRDDTISKVIKVYPDLYSLGGVTTICCNHILMWVKTIEFKYWLATLLEVNINSATELLFSYVCGLTHPMMPSPGRLISHDKDYYELHIKFIF